jgi:uncharacterized protein
MKVAATMILLQSGSYFDFADPEGSKVTVWDIAHALSHLCRFTGHTTRFYSVAEHSVLASFMVPEEDALAALLHDAAEAVMADMSSPLKSLMPEYKALEQRVERAILADFGITDMPPSVKEADLMMLAIEQRQVMKNDDSWLDLPDLTGQDYEWEISFWDPPTARLAFLLRYEELVEKDIVRNLVHPDPDGARK